MQDDESETDLDLQTFNFGHRDIINLAPKSFLIARDIALKELCKSMLPVHKKAWVRTVVPVTATRIEPHEVPQEATLVAQERTLNKAKNSMGEVYDRNHGLAERIRRSLDFYGGAFKEQLAKEYGIKHGLKRVAQVLGAASPVRPTCQNPHPQFSTLTNSTLLNSRGHLCWRRAIS